MALVLTCQSLARRFGHRTVFENVSLSVFDGDRIGLIGPNGAGKSTLLRLLAQTETPDSGTVASSLGGTLSGGPPAGGPILAQASRISRAVRTVTVNHRRSKRPRDSSTGHSRITTAVRATTYSAALG